MENTYQKHSISRIVAWIVAAILLITAVGAIVMFSRKDKDDATTTFQDGLIMTAVPTIRLSEPQGVRFTAVVTPELYNEVTEDEHKKFGMVIAPVSYFMKVDVGETQGDCDWVKSFEAESLTVITMEDITPYADTEPDGTLIDYRFNCSVTNVLYKNINLQFLGIGYVKTTNGENVEYKYASFENGLLYKECAFYNCRRLTSITIGNSVTSIGRNAFSGCSSLQYNEYDNAYYLGNDSNPYVVLVKAKSEAITTCTIHEKTKVIYSSAFCNCSSLTSITIPDSVTSIGDYAFYGCGSLTSITIGNSVTSIGYEAFSYCSSLTSITIPDSITSIGYDAFLNCSSLTSVTFENTNGWYVTENTNGTSGTSVTVTNSSKNATYLKSTYDDYYWKRG